MRRLTIGMVLTLATLSGACGGTPSKKLVLVVPRATDGEFWRTVRAGASQAAKDNDAYLEWPSDFAPNDVEGQANVLKAARLRALVEHLPYAFAFAPIWGVGFRDLIRDWELDGFRLNTFDEDLTASASVTSTYAPASPTTNLRGLVSQPNVAGEQDAVNRPGTAPPDDDARFVSHVGTFNSEAGRTAARQLIAQIKATPRGRPFNVAMLRLNPLSASTTSRERGFLSEMSQAKDVATIASYDHYAIGVGPESGFREALELIDDMQAQKKSLDAVFCPNESTTVGMLRALENRGLAGQVLFVGFDQSPILVNALLKGTINALVVQDPYVMGYVSVQQALAVISMDQETFIARARNQTLPLIYTQHQAVSTADLVACQAMAHSQTGKNLTGRAMADALLGDTRSQEERCLREGGAACQATVNGSDERRFEDVVSDVKQGCNLTKLNLLYPSVVIYHLAAPGSNSK